MDRRIKALEQRVVALNNFLEVRRSIEQGRSPRGRKRPYTQVAEFRFRGSTTFEPK